MASDATSFQYSTRQLLAHLFIDTGSGLVDYASNVISFSILETANLKPFGIFETELEANLYFPNSTVDWSSPGKSIKAIVSTTNDNGATWFDAQLFLGTTERSTTVPNKKVKIKASSYNSNYLDNDAPNATYTNSDANQIIKSILLGSGVSSGAISITDAGLTIPAFIVAPGTSIRDNIMALAAVTLQVYGFDATGIFVNRSYAQEFPGSTNSYYYNEIIEYKNRNIYDCYYNKISIRGREVEYINTSFGTIASYFASGFQGEKLLPNATQLFTIPLPDFYVVSASTHQLVDDTYFVTFRSADDDVSSMVSRTVVSEFVTTADDGSQSLVIKVKNNTSTTAYLRSASIFIEGLKLKGDIVSQYTDSAAIARDGKVYELKIASSAIQSQSIADLLLAIVQRHYTTPNNLYAQKVNARHNDFVGLPVQLSVSPQNPASILGYILESDRDISANGGYKNTIIIKKVPDPLTFLLCDDSATPGTLCDQDYCYY